jgi:hypothetical protein
VSTRSWIAERSEMALFADGFDDAIIGMSGGVVVYDRDKCIAILAADMTYDEAEEYFDYNVSGAYVGEYTPLFIEMVPAACS